jgi:hypothetical protein
MIQRRVAGKVAIMKEAKTNGQRRNGTHGVGAKSNGAAAPISMAATSADPGTASTDRSDWTQVNFRAPRCAKKFLEVFCAEHEVTTQTLGLKWLQSLGAPVCDADLDDQRTSKPRTRIDSGLAKEGTDRGNEAPTGGPQDVKPDLGFLADIVRLARGHGAGQPPVIQVFVVTVASDGRSPR